MADYAADRAEALVDILEDGALGVMSWLAHTTNADTGAQTPAGSYTANVGVLLLSQSTRGRTPADALQFRNKKRFYAVPVDPLVTMEEGRSLTVAGVKYEIETCNPLTLDGATVILYEGTLRPGGE